MNEPWSPTVLVVDDDAMVGTIYKLRLERDGFKVVVADDGIAALEAVAKARPDIILLDIKMPRMDGIEVLRRLSADEVHRAIPVVMFSNFDDPAMVKETLSLGAKQYCVKANIDPATLGSLVMRWLGPDKTAP